jgi:hypothetical protein
MRLIKGTAKVVVYIGLLLILALLIASQASLLMTRDPAGVKAWAFLIILLPEVVVIFALSSIGRFFRLARAVLALPLEPPVGIAKGMVGVAKGIVRLRSQRLAVSSSMSETEKRMMPYALMGFVITMACSLVVLAIGVVLLTLFLRQVSLGTLLFFVVFYTVTIVVLWKPVQWWLKVTHAREIYKDGRWQPMPRRGQQK